MELREFVSKSLEDVLGGVVDASKKFPPKTFQFLLRSGDKYSSTSVDFDIAVTTEESKSVNREGGAGAGIKVVQLVSGSIGGKAGSTSETSSSTVSRIKFSVGIEQGTVPEKLADITIV